MSSSWSLYEDPRNKDLLVWVGAKGRGRLVTRENAGVSPWDSSVQGGDAVVSSLLFCVCVVCDESLDDDCSYPFFLMIML